MTIEIKIPDSLRLDTQTLTQYRAFLQTLMNRRVVGGLRYSQRPKRKQRYLTRIRLELKAYERTGNFEHLLNIANYCFLESEAPENRKFHFDPNADSATRPVVGGSIA